MTKPMTTLTEDWAEHTWPMKIGNTEYEVRCHVYLTFKEVPDPYNVTGRDTQVADYNLETFDCLPKMKPEHEKEIERQLLVRLEEEYGTN